MAKKKDSPQSPEALGAYSHSITGCKEDDEHVPGDILDLDYAVAERRRRI
jgi:hypothetical protein